MLYSLIHGEFENTFTIVTFSISCRFSKTRIFLLLLIGRYVAPEVFKQEEYDTKVDVFSFALILQEVTIFLFQLCQLGH